MFVDVIFSKISIKLISAYAPQSGYLRDVLDTFYDELHSCLEDARRRHFKIVVGGDFSTRLNVGHRGAILQNNGWHLTPPIPTISNDDIHHTWDMEVDVRKWMWHPQTYWFHPLQPGLTFCFGPCNIRFRPWFRPSCRDSLSWFWTATNLENNTFSARKAMETSSGSARCASHMPCYFGRTQCQTHCRIECAGGCVVTIGSTRSNYFNLVNVKTRVAWSCFSEPNLQKRKIYTSPLGPCRGHVCPNSSRNHCGVTCDKGGMPERHKYCPNFALGAGSQPPNSSNIVDRPLFSLWIFRGFLGNISASETCHDTATLASLPPFTLEELGIVLKKLHYGKMFEYSNIPLQHCLVNICNSLRASGFFETSSQRTLFTMLLHNGDTSQPSNWRPIAVLMQDILAFDSQQDRNNKQVIKQVSDPTPGLIRLLIFYACHPKLWSGMPRFGLRVWIWRKHVAVSNTAALHKLVCLVYRWQLNMFKWIFFTQEMRLEHGRWRSAKKYGKILHCKK